MYSQVKLAFAHTWVENVELDNFWYLYTPVKPLQVKILMKIFITPKMTTSPLLSLSHIPAFPTTTTDLFSVTTD